MTTRTTHHLAGYRRYHVARLTTGQDGGVTPESYYLLNTAPRIPRDRDFSPWPAIVVGAALGLGAFGALCLLAYALSGLLR